MLFHWELTALAPGWAKRYADHLTQVLGNRVTVVADEVGDKVVLTVDEVFLEVRNKNGTARGSIDEGSGSWKEALIILLGCRILSGSIVDDDTNSVSVRSLKKQPNLGFCEEEFDNFADALGLINRAMANSRRFATFIQ